MYLSKAPKALVVSLITVSCNILPMVSYAAPGANVDRAPELDCAESHQGQAAAYQQFQTGKKRPVNEVTQDDDNPAAQKKATTGEAPVDAGIGVKESHANNPHFLTKEKDAGELSIALSIVSALSASDQHSFALTSREMHKAVVHHRMKNDRRALETKPWVIGPPVGSMELYRFNAAVWHALKSIVNLRDELQGEQPDHSLRPQLFISLSMAQEFLQQEFQAAYPLATSPVAEFFHVAYPQATNPVAEFIASAKSHLLLKCQNVRNIPPADYQGLRCLAGDPANTGERDLMRVSCYLNDTAYDPANGVWADTEVSPDRWSYLRRDTEFKRARFFVEQSRPIHPEEKAEFLRLRNNNWDFILSYSDEVTADDIRGATSAYTIVLGADNFRANCPRAAELYEKLFIEHPDQVTANDISYALIANYKAENYKRELSLSQWLVEEFAHKVDRDAMAEAARIFRKNGEFESEVKLYDKWQISSWATPIQHSIACFATGEFERGIEIHQSNLADFSEAKGNDSLDWFRMLHIDIENFSERLYRMYKVKKVDDGNRFSDPLKDDEVAIYDSIFYNSSKLPLDAIDEYLDAMSSDGISYIDSVILLAGIFMHAKQVNWERVQRLASNIHMSFMVFQDEDR